MIYEIEHCYGATSVPTSTSTPSKVPSTTHRHNSLVT